VIEPHCPGPRKHRMKVDERVLKWEIRLERARGLAWIRRREKRCLIAARGLTVFKLFLSTGGLCGARNTSASRKHALFRNLPA